MTFDKHGILCVAAAIMCVPMDANSVRLKRRITVLRTFVRSYLFLPAKTGRTNKIQPLIIPVKYFYLKTSMN